MLNGNNRLSTSLFANRRGPCPAPSAAAAAASASTSGRGCSEPPCSAPGRACRPPTAQPAHDQPRAPLSHAPRRWRDANEGPSAPVTTTTRGRRTRGARGDACFRRSANWSLRRVISYSRCSSTPCLRAGTRAENEIRAQGAGGRADLAHHFLPLSRAALTLTQESYTLSRVNASPSSDENVCRACGSARRAFIDHSRALTPMPSTTYG